MVEIVKVSEKHQIVIPKESRKTLGIGKGDELIVETRDGKIMIKPKPKNYTRHMLGLHKNVWKKTDVDKYIEEERKNW